MTSRHLLGWNCRELTMAAVPGRGAFLEHSVLTRRWRQTYGPVPVDYVGKNHSVVRCGHMEVFPEPKVVSHLGRVYLARRPYRQHAPLDLLRVTFLGH